MGTRCLLGPSTALLQGHQAGHPSCLGGARRRRWHQQGGLERQSKKTKSAFLNELQNLLQWFAPVKEVGNLLPGKEGWGVGKG